MDIFCENCGNKEIEENSKFCTECGELINHDNEKITEVKQKSTIVDNRLWSMKNKNILIILGCVLVVFVLLLTSKSIYTEYKNQQQQTQTLLQQQKEALDAAQQQIKDTQNKADEENKTLQNQVNNLENAKPKTVSATTSYAGIISKWSSNVALILCDYDDGSAGFGSGFLYKNNGEVVVITNKHVFTEESSGYNATNCSIQIPGDTQYYTINNTYEANGNPFKTGASGDWGYIKVSGGDSYFNNAANSAEKNLTICQKQEQTGSNVIVLGYPDYAGQFDNPTATQGIISGYASPYYTTSAQIESGNSGGVAIDPDKDCYIGIPSAVKVGNFSSLGRILDADVPFTLNY